MGKNTKKFYAVAAGYKVGIYTTWEDAHVNIDGYKGACYKGYKTLSEAKEHMRVRGHINPIIFRHDTFRSSSSDTEVAAEQNNANAISTETASSRPFLVIDHNDSSDSGNFYDDTLPKYFHSYTQCTEVKIPSCGDCLNTSSEYIPNSMISSRLITSNLKSLNRDFVQKSNDLSESESQTNLKYIDHELNTTENIIINTCNKNIATESKFAIIDSCNSSPKNEKLTKEASTQITSLMTDMSTQTDFNKYHMDEMLARLDARDETIEAITNELHLFKIQMKNEIKTLHNAIEDSKVNNDIFNDVKNSHDRIKNYMSDHKSMAKDILSLCNGLENKSKSIDRDLASLKCTIDNLASEVSKINNLSHSSEHANIDNNYQYCNGSCKSPQESHTQVKENMNSEFLSSYDPTNITIDSGKSEKSYVSDSNSSSTDKNPRDELFSIYLDNEEFKGTNFYILGDSQISLIKAHKMAHRDTNEDVTKISVPGITPKDLFDWLKIQSPQPNVNDVIIHVGANSCLRGKVVEKLHWNLLIRQAKYIFPNAKIIMSTMIPVGSRDKISKIISTSINNLWDESKFHSQVIVVDHTDTFLTKFGAPILELFQKRLHPNLQGAARMAYRLKYPNKAQHFKYDNSTQYSQVVGSLSGLNKDSKLPATKAPEKKSQAAKVIEEQISQLQLLLNLVP